MRCVSWVLIVECHHLPFKSDPLILYHLSLGTQILLLWPASYLQEVCERILEVCVAQAEC